MRYLFWIGGLAFWSLAFLIFVASRGAVHEIGALVACLTGTMMMATGAILEALGRIEKAARQAGSPT